MDETPTPSGTGSVTPLFRQAAEPSAAPAAAAPPPAPEERVTRVESSRSRAARRERSQQRASIAIGLIFLRDEAADLLSDEEVARVGRALDRMNADPAPETQALAYRVLCDTITRLSPDGPQPSLEHLRGAVRRLRARQSAVRGGDPDSRVQLAEVHTLLGVAEQTAYTWRTRGTLPKPGPDGCFDRAQLLSWAAQRGYIDPISGERTTTEDDERVALAA